MAQPKALKTGEERFEDAVSLWRRCVPLAAALLLLIPMGVPLFLYGPGLPHLGMLCVYYWAVHRPLLFPPWLAFSFGLVCDAWMGMPLGLNAVLMLLLAALLNTQFEVFASRPFLFAWAVLAPSCVAYHLASWAVLQLLGFPLSVVPFLVQSLLSYMMYPLISLLLSRIQQAVVDQ